MSREEQRIRRITEILPAAPERATPVYAADCELAVIDGVSLLCSLDDFSAEDLFRTDNPERLGWNIACAALADIFACGGIAKLYSHALVPAPDWDSHFLDSFARGVSAALQGCGAGFLGGDMGHGKEWRYTAQVIGRPRDRMVDRRGARHGDALYLSGRIGLGNLEAALGLYGNYPVLQKAFSVYQPRFRLLHRESELVAHYASAAIDTSDGLASSVLQLADQSQVGFTIGSIPYHNLAGMASRFLRKPRILLALGGCGEYELLFSVPTEREVSLLQEARRKKLNIFRIGSIIESQASRSLGDERHTVDLTHSLPQARDFGSLPEYLQMLERYAQGEQC
jgi:thiamine-monophosphate kinase